MKIIKILRFWPDLSVENRTRRRGTLKWAFLKKKSVDFTGVTQILTLLGPKNLSTSSCDSGHKVRRKWGDFAERLHSL